MIYPNFYSIIIFVSFKIDRAVKLNKYILFNDYKSEHLHSFTMDFEYEDVYGDQADRQGDLNEQLENYLDEEDEEEEEFYEEEWEGEETTQCG